MQQIKSLFKDSIVYGLSGIVSSFISIFLIPLYTKVFAPADYGIISIMTTTSALLSILLIFSLDNSAAVWFWDKPDTEERKKTFNSWLGFLVSSGVVVGVTIALLSIPLSRLFFDTPAYAILFLLLGANLLFVGFQKVVNIWCRMLQKPLLAMVFSLTILLITVGLNILFILVWRIGVKGVFYSQLIASVAGLLLLLLFFKDWIGFRFFSKERLREMLRFSAPLVPATIMYWLMNTASVYFLKAYVKDNAEIGLYQVGASVANILSLVTWAFFQAWTPFALSVSRQDNARRIYSFVFELYCIAGLFIAFALMLVSKDILVIFTNSGYFGAATVLGLLAVNVVLVGMPNILAIANSLVKKNISYAVAIGVGSVFTVILFMIFIPLFGKEGAAISMIAGNLLIVLLLAYKAQQLYFIPYHFVRIISTILIGGTLFVLLQQLNLTFIEKIIAILIIFSVLTYFFLKVIKKQRLIDNI